MKIELKSCPFCGGDAAHNDGGHSTYGRLWWTVGCNECEIYMSDKEVWHDWGGPNAGLLNCEPMECVGRWNTRSSAEK